MWPKIENELPTGVRSQSVTATNVNDAYNFRLERAAVALSEEDDLFANEEEKENETEAEPQDKGDAVSIFSYSF